MKLQVALLSVLAAITIGGAKAATYEAVHVFPKDRSETGAVNPRAPLVFDLSGAIYGVLSSSTPEAYKLTPPVNGTKWTVSKLFSFPHTDITNCALLSGLVMDKSGNLYGVSAGCWDHEEGTIYELSPPKKAGEKWTGTPIFEFGNNNLGEFPQDALSIDSEGNLYGSVSGASYKLSPPANGEKAWTGKHIGPGSGPNLLPVDENTVFAEVPNGNSNVGEIVELKHQATGWTHWILKTMHLLNGGDAPDGYYPQGGLVADKSGNLYGTTLRGGALGKKIGTGTVFQLKPPATGSAGWTYDVLFAFNGANGIHPGTGVTIDSAGNLYGVTECGGKWSTDPASTGGEGTVFRLSPPVAPGGSRVHTTVYQPQKAFFPQGNCSNLTAFNGPLVIGKDGALYGTANGPAADGGSVFRIVP